MLAVVTGLIGSYPVAGMTFHYIQYVLGLQALGWQVVYLEDTGRWLYDPCRSTFTGDPQYAVSYLGSTMAHFGLRDSWCLRDPTDRWHGPVAGQLSEVLPRVDLFLNVSGSCWLRPEYRAARNLVYIDTDPGYTQFKVRQASADDADADLRYSFERMAEHDFHATFAENIAADDCSLPTEPFRWIPTRQPIALDLWRLRPAARPVRFSSILSWNHYAEPFRHGDEVFWGKRPEVMKVLRLPRRTGADLELAVSGDGPIDELRRHGWRVRSAASVSSSPRDYQRYIEASGAEFSVAKDIYTTTHSGWFSERTACYLASGRPAVVQDTGFTTSIPRGAGLHAFRDLDEAADAIRSVEADFENECEQARKLAARCFDARRVLVDLLNALGL
jgi:hypothetical protein